MEFFIPCWIALGGMFTDTPSKSYIHKQSKTFASRLQVCNRVAIEARSQEVDPVLAISKARHESGFNPKVTSGKGAKGAMGVMPQYHCPKTGKCDYTKAGVSALKLVTEMYPNNTCQALAVYNRGPKHGLCKEGRSEYYYAQAVLSLYEELCAKTDFCEGC